MQPDNQPQEEELKPPNLKFAEIYNSAEWKELAPIARAQLLLVAEGIKPGTIIEGNFTSFQEIIRQMGLATHLNSEPFLLQPVYEVASAATLSEHRRDFIALPEKVTQEDYHKINGKFLGYPACCTEEYNRPKKNMAERKRLRLRGSNC